MNFLVMSSTSWGSVAEMSTTCVVGGRYLRVVLGDWGMTAAMRCQRHQQEWAEAVG